MLGHKYGCLPVVEHGRLAGMLTEADFVKYLVSGNPPVRP
jgi:CBS domain-containing membrane protein